MSLEMAIEQERQEIVEMLEKERPHRPKRESTSSHGSRSPIRRSILDPNVPISPRKPSFSRTAPYPPPKSSSANSIDSMGEPSSPPPAHPTRTTSDPEITKTDVDGTTEEVVPLRKIDSDPATSPTKPRKGSNEELETHYDIQTKVRHAPRKTPNGGKRPVAISSMASVVNSTDLGGSLGGPPVGRIPGGILKLPSSPLGRASSPRTSTSNLMPVPESKTLDQGAIDEPNQAYRNYSGYINARPTGLASPPLESPGEVSDTEGFSPPMSPRDLKIDRDAHGDEAIESSESDSDESSGDEDDSEVKRGRRRRWSKGDTENGHPPNGDDDRAAEEGGAEDDGEANTSAYNLSEPEVTITGPSGERLNPRRPGVHPTTSFDNTGSNVSTPFASDEEADISDIRRAQRLSVHISPIQSTPESHRTIRTIIRGEFSKLQDEAAKGLRRQRTYLVCTDLSDEAAHALEWTIGTVLRDGDTLLALYAVDEETGTGRAGANDAHSQGIAIGDAALAVKDQAAVIGSLTAKAEAGSSGRSPSIGRRSPSLTRSSSKRRSLSVMPSPLLAPSSASLAPITNALGSARASSRDPSGQNRAERERIRATEDLTQSIIKLLRKTRLQVRVVIEVIHCKSPKHLITEVIDFIEPTLVILGSRGRSALKGVLLGSFSNYLVTKSSVPVMVARKKLRKHSRYYQRPVRLSNNLTKPGLSLLAAAKID